MKIGDLTPINEGVLGAIGGAVLGGINKAGQWGLLGDEYKTKANNTAEYKKTKQIFVQLFNKKFDQAVAGGQIQTQPQQTQPQQTQPQQTSKGFTQGNYKQGTTTVIPPTKIATPAQQSKPQQPQGQAVDLDQLKQQRQAKQDQGVADQQVAMGQMAQTKQANAATAQADNDLVAAVKAAKAKPGFQQTAQDKLTIQKGAAKGIHESVFTDYDLFDAILESVVNKRTITEAQGISVADFVMKVINSQQRNNYGSTGDGTAKYKATFEQLAKSFEQEYLRTGKFPTEIAGKIFDYLKSEEQMNDTGEDFAGKVQAPLAGSASQTPSTPTTASSPSATNQPDTDTQGKPADPATLQKQATQAIQDIGKANGNIQSVAKALISVISVSGVTDIKALFDEIEKQAAAQQPQTPAQ
jgi:hypothetical protein